MKLIEIIEILENISPAVLQEHYDNCGLITGKNSWNCTGILCTLDCTEEVVVEAIAKKCNLIIAHHPIIFNGLKKINGNNYVEKAVITAIKNDIAIYAIHTNLDNILTGVNGMMADQLKLVNRKVLIPKQNLLKKLQTFIPADYAEQLKAALFVSGAGNIGQYSDCSFSTEGLGSFRPGNNTTPFSGEKEKRNTEQEVKIEMVFPAFLENQVIQALLTHHPYEEAAYDIIPISNTDASIGSGLIGELPEPADETAFLQTIKTAFGLQVIRHTGLCNKKVKIVAVCGGAGSFLIKKAVAAGADFYITSDVKYHEFFDTEGRLVLADIGHWESEQFTPDLLVRILKANFPTFAVLKSEVNTNPVQYFV